MNTPAGQPWSQSVEQLDPMAIPTDLSDVDNFFNFGEIDLDGIPNVDPSQYADQLQQHADQLQQHASTNPSTPFNDLHEPPPTTSTQDFGGHEQFGMAQHIEQHQQFLSRDHSQAPTSHPFTTDSIYQPPMRPAYHGGLPQQYQFQHQQQDFPPGHHVPPTPNSFEMHGEAGRFMQQQLQQLDPQQRAIMEQRYQVRKDDAIAFTPMVSPAGTPQYSMQPDYGTTVPGAYFSPLTSPMLHAQNAQHQQRHHRPGYYTNPSTAPNSNATSPVDPTIDVDMVGDGISLGAPNSHIRKSRRKPATPRSIGGGLKVRQSPIQKPQKRKSGTLSSASDVDKLMVDIQLSGQPQPGSAGLQTPAPFGVSSEESSISPEPLSESLMGPPPRPDSNPAQSPAMIARQKEANNRAGGHAATPNSLLSLRGDQQQPIGGQQSLSQTSQVSPDGGIEDLQLPEAASQQASKRPPLMQINTRIASADSDEHTPRMSARKTPKLGPLSTPSSARPTSALLSPSAIGSPMSGSTPANLLRDRPRSESKGGRGEKKRGGTAAHASIMVSPALRPRISPSIKPLLPEGTALHSPTHALLLASKSNYQNLLEGNHLPGVNYPDSLSTGLTSKRTSHKVAEQGRRNRINEALKEMLSLIPKQSLKPTKDSNSDASPEAGPGAGADAEGKESKEDAQAKSNNSKAATVESANVYIKDMQRQQREMLAELAQLRKEREEMQKQLRDTQVGATSSERSSSAVDSASPASAKVH